MLNSPYSFRGRSFATIFVLALIAALAVLPVFFETEANRTGSGLIVQTKSADPDRPNYDIRSDKQAYKTLAMLRDAHGGSASSAADLRDEFVRGENSLRSKVASLKVVYGLESRVPEVISPDVKMGKNALAAANGDSRSEVLRRFIGENSSLFGLRSDQVGQLVLKADYKNPESPMAFVRLEQELRGVPVFGGEVRAGFAKNGSLVRVINNLAAGVDESVSDDFGKPSDAFAIAAANIGYTPKGGYAEQQMDKDGLAYSFGDGEWDPVARKVYFQTEPGVAVPAWSLLIWKPLNAFYIVVDANSGTVLWRKNISEDQTQPATYNVWLDPNAMIKVADSPFPLTPGPTSPNGAQGAAISRTLLSIVGNEPPYTFNNNGWITDGGTSTDGNAVQAGLDRDTTDGVDASNGMVISAGRNFDFPINPGIPSNPIVNQGDAPVPAGEPVASLPNDTTPGVCNEIVQPHAQIDFQRASVTQLFYITNRYHDELYRLGFTEQAGNFQHDNFGRGGQANDRISAEGQDCVGVNNANFGTPPDGFRPRMQMFLWPVPTPDFDGNLDADVVVHEITHGLSNRLHGNSVGLSGNMARGMGEGWSDFYGHALLSTAADDPNGIYTTGAYDTYRLRVGNELNNAYYGIRRFPKAVITSTGGPNNRPHNPLTFRDVDATQQSLNDGAFAPAFNATADQVHAAGEVWSSMLWEVRYRYIQRLGWEVGNRRILQHVTDGMKLAPSNPTFIDSRDAIIAAALAGGEADDVRDIWAGFAVRGLGASAEILNPGSGNGTARVTEAFDLPNLTQPGITISDASGDNDGYPEPGEPIRVTVPLENATGNAATGVSVTIVGGSTVAYGTIAHNGSASNQINFTVPAGTLCGNVLDLTINVTSSLGPVSFSRQVIIGVPVTTFTENFDGVTAPAFPNDWTVSTEAGGTAFVTSTTGSNSAPNSAFALDPTTVGGGTSITSPLIPIQANAATISFKNKFDTEDGWDGGVLEISINGGGFQDIAGNGGFFVEGGYNGILGDSTGNPIELRNAWSGNSGGYITSTAVIQASASGQNVRFRWRFGADNNTAATGWNVDDIKVVGSYGCSFNSVQRDTRADFDGDGITDFSVYRPSEGNWYIFGSQQSFFAYGWGASQDIPVPADYDRDGKTDPAVFRGDDPAGAAFYILKSNGFLFEARPWGSNGDLPVVGDYDGDRNPDAALYRESDGAWYILKTTGGFEIVPFGQAGDIAVPGDFDGDGRYDQTVFRDGLWITRNSTGGFNFDWWGVGSDMLVPADYDGDLRDDLAIFRASDGVWWIKRSSDGQVEPRIWGQPGDIPVPGNYDTDGKADVAVYRNGEWYAQKTGGGTSAAYFGASTDLPIPFYYIPR
ncbi:MAG: M36 family metallopeptidase [Pyrinomonadaceae bacterium]